MISISNNKYTISFILHTFLLLLLLEILPETYYHTYMDIQTSDLTNLRNLD